MKNAKLYLFSKTIHRWMVLAIIITGCIMMTTGLCMYFNQYFFFDPAAIRSLHSTISVFFALILGVMMTTGTYLFIIPYLPNKENDSAKKM